MLQATATVDTAMLVSSAGTNHQRARLPALFLSDLIAMECAGRELIGHPVLSGVELLWESTCR
jgi:hypothetical protein